jgi:hypothetical protein
LEARRKRFSSTGSGKNGWQFPPTYEVDGMLPPDELFLSAVQPVDVDGQPNLLEKKMLLAALRFYFGPGQWWNTVRDVTDVNSLDRLNTTLRQPGERYETLEQQTGLGANYFANDHPNTDQVKLYAAATRNNPGRVPSYFLYEARYNLTFYVGPDWYHDPRGKLVAINTLVLDAQHRPVRSHTLRFGCEL